MKITIVSVILLFVLLGCTSKKTLEIKEETDIEKELMDEMYLWAFKHSVNVREKNNAVSAKIHQLIDGDSVIVLENLEGWYRIKTKENKNGWVRSDLLGPKNLSIFHYALSFVDSLKETEGTDLYFDKKLYHKRIYLSYSPDVYTSRSAVEEKTRSLVERYQSEVYRGQVTARVLKPGSEEEFLTSTFNGAINAEPLLPVIPFGKIKSVNRDIPGSIVLQYSVPVEISEQKLLATAREMSSIFPLSYQHVEIIYSTSPVSNQNNCRLWFKEDQNGEEFKFNHCE
jgi:hypothetical protein